MFHFRALLLGCVLLLLPHISFAADPPASDQLSGSHTIAVADFSGAYPDVGRFIAETLLTDLAQSRLLHFAERSEIRRALDELKLQATGLIDSQQITQLGKLVSADRLIVGSYLEADDQIIINARLLDVESGRLAEGGAGNVSGERRNLLSLVHRLAHQFHRRVTGADFVIDGEGAEAPSLPFTPLNARPTLGSNRLRPSSDVRSTPYAPTSPQPAKFTQTFEDHSGYRVRETASDSGGPRLTVPTLAPKPSRLGVPWQRPIPPNPYPYRPLRIRLDLQLVNLPPGGSVFSWRIQ